MKYLSLLLAIVLIFSLASCVTQTDDHEVNGNEVYSDNYQDQTGGSNDSNASNSNNSSNTNNGGGASVNVCDHNWSDATCTLPKICYKCNVSEGNALGHTTDAGICTRCGENFSSWQAGAYTDEFGQETKTKYMASIDYSGKFSNSATTDSKLYAALQIDKTSIGIILWEYGSRAVKGTFDSEQYSITILDESGAKHTFTGTLYKGNTKILFGSADRTKLTNILSSNNSIQIHMKTSKYTVSTYLFKINTAGFDSIYNSILQ